MQIVLYCRSNCAACWKEERSSEGLQAVHWCWRKERRVNEEVKTLLLFPMYSTIKLQDKKITNSYMVLGLWHFFNDTPSDGPLHHSSAHLNLLLSNSDPVDPEEVTRDPVAAYKLLRQLRKELINIVKHIQPHFYQCNEYQYELEFLEIPQREDLDGAASGLIRLQEIYKFYPDDIMKGELSAVLLQCSFTKRISIVSLSKISFDLFWFYRNDIKCRWSLPCGVGRL